MPAFLQGRVDGLRVLANFMHTRSHSFAASPQEMEAAALRQARKLYRHEGIIKALYVDPSSNRATSLLRRGRQRDEDKAPSKNKGVELQNLRLDSRHREKVLTGY